MSWQCATILLVLNPAILVQEMVWAVRLIAKGFSASVTAFGSEKQEGTL